MCKLCQKTFAQLTHLKKDETVHDMNKEKYNRFTAKKEDLKEKCISLTHSVKEDMLEAHNTVLIDPFAKSMGLVDKTTECIPGNLNDIHSNNTHHMLSLIHI